MGTTALRASSSSTSTPSFRPPARAALVAPMLPLPTSRTSMSSSSLDITRPKGMEPDR
jgi:hypothetical protein